MVKGLDYALLHKVRSELHKPDDGDDYDQKSRYPTLYLLLTHVSICMLAYLPTDQYAISLLYLILFMLFLTADRISKEEHPVSFRTANAKVALLPKNLVDFLSTSYSAPCLC